MKENDKKNSKETYNTRGEKIFELNVKDPLFQSLQRNSERMRPGHEWRDIDYHADKKEEQLTPEEKAERELQRLGVDFIEEWRDGNGNLHRQAYEIKCEEATLKRPFNRLSPSYNVQQMAKGNAKEREEATIRGTGNYYIELKQRINGKEVDGWYPKARNEKNRKRLKEEFSITDGRIFVMLSEVQTEVQTKVQTEVQTEVQTIQSSYFIATFIEEESLFQIVDSILDAPDHKGVDVTQWAVKLPIDKVFTAEHLKKYGEAMFGQKNLSIVTDPDPESGAWRMRFEAKAHFEEQERIRQEDLNAENTDRTLPDA